MTDTALVTGGFGLVGTETVNRLAAAGRRVVVADLDTPANRKKARALPAGVTARWADLTDADGGRSARLRGFALGDRPPRRRHPAAALQEPRPRPQGQRRCHRGVGARRRGTTESAALRPGVEQRRLRVAQSPPRNRRRPRRYSAPAFRAVQPTKFEAEEYVRASSLEWVVLRLGGVLSPNFSALPLTADGIFIESALPTDGRIHTVDVRDVGSAFAAATTADVAREILLIGGDDSHKLLQKDVGPALAAALGLPGVLPEGRPGDPNDDDSWFLTDWMDTARAQEALAFQQHSWPAMLAEMSARMGWKRHPLRLVAPLGAGVSRPPRRVPQCAGHLRRSVGSDRSQAGRSLPGHAAAGRASRGPTGSRRSAGCGTTRLQHACRRRRGSSAR